MKAETLPEGGYGKGMVSGWGEWVMGLEEVGITLRIVQTTV